MERTSQASQAPQWHWAVPAGRVEDAFERGLGPSQFFPARAKGVKEPGRGWKFGHPNFDFSAVLTLLFCILLPQNPQNACPILLVKLDLANSIGQIRMVRRPSVKWLLSTKQQEMGKDNGGCT